MIIYENQEKMSKTKQEDKNMKEVCPFIERHKFCVHRRETSNQTKKRGECGYKKYENCDLFLEWFELNSSNSSLNN